MCASSLSPEDKAIRLEEKERNKTMERKMWEDSGKESRIHKLLLLGPAGCGKTTTRPYTLTILITLIGKTTLLKQLQSIYGAGFPEHER